ncbi:MAG TPA: peptide chain release factor N(5)-glutamine methyltransferase [Candidatus Limnocylindrales bacterium]
MRDLLEPAVARLRASGSPSPRLDAELLLGHVLGVDRAAVLAHPEAPVGTGQAAALETALARRAQGEPVAYIRGVKEFYGLALTADPRALIPRPETELLVDLAQAWVRARLTSAPRAADTPPVVVLDVGTGSGAIAVALAVTFRRRGYGDAVCLLASDVSADALGLAVENAVGHGVADAIEFRRADLLAGVAAGADGTVDLLVANLPYVPSGDLPGLPVAASFEPPLALDGGPDGSSVIARLLEDLEHVLAPDGVALLEIGDGQEDRLRALVSERLPGWTSVLHDDLGGSPRVLELAPGPHP